MPACRYMEENGSAAILDTKRLGGVTVEVNLREHVTCMPLPSMNKAAYRGISGPTKRTSVFKKLK